MFTEMFTEFEGFPGGSDGKESACNAGNPGFIPGWGGAPGGGHDNPLQYSCLENPMDKGAWRATPWGRIELDTTERLNFTFFHLYNSEVTHIHKPI